MPMPEPVDPDRPTPPAPAADAADAPAPVEHAAEPAAETPEELGGPKGPEPTRFGDWERKGRCIDF